MARAKRSQELISELTPEQLTSALRPLKQRKQLVAMRLDADVAAWLRAFGPGYSTRANAILKAVMARAK